MAAHNNIKLCISCAHRVHAQQSSDSTAIEREDIDRRVSLLNAMLAYLFLNPNMAMPP